MAANSVLVMGAVVDLLEDTLNIDGLEISKRYTSRKNYAELANPVIDVFGISFADEGPADRGNNFYDVTIDVLYTERYVNQSEPEVPDSWVEEKLELVEKQIFSLLADSRLRLQVDGVTYWPERAEIVTLYNPLYLDEDSVFQSEMSITFRKIDSSPVLQGS